MLTRLLKLKKNHSLILFGARGTGKSTLFKQSFNPASTLWIDLLDPSQDERFANDPEELKAIVKALPAEITHVVIDEIQKNPKLLDVVHGLIESTDKHFALSGSSARKLKHAGANLLAGRAFVYHLFPLSFLELGDRFNLENALRFGLLPKVTQLQEEDEKILFLQAYSYTYLKEEVWGEQLIRKLDPFRKFLEVSAQCNGKIINYSNIANDVGVDDKTIKEYFTILEDTLIGTMLEPFQHSFRKRLSQKPKFYYFDLGVTRALSRLLSVPLSPRTSHYGEVFEHFIILECLKLSAYFKTEYRFSYLKTKDDAEVDIVIERPGAATLFIEIKSNNDVKEKDLRALITISKDFPDCEPLCLSNDKLAKKYNNVTVLPWQQGIRYIFGIK
jgi:predicted AAA+ superfamily ATPase